MYTNQSIRPWARSFIVFLSCLGIIPIAFPTQGVRTSNTACSVFGWMWDARVPVSAHATPESDHISQPLNNLRQSTVYANLGLNSLHWHRIGRGCLTVSLAGCNSLAMRVETQFDTKPQHAIKSHQHTKTTLLVRNLSVRWLRKLLGFRHAMRVCKLQHSPAIRNPGPLVTRCGGCASLRASREQMDQRPPRLSMCSALFFGANPHKSPMLHTATRDQPRDVAQLCRLSDRISRCDPPGAWAGPLGHPSGPVANPVSY